MNQGSKHLTITVMSGAEDGRIFELQRFPVVLGRHPDDNVFFPHYPGVSRHHARITCKGDTFFIEDLGEKGRGSTNGTYLNDQRIKTRTSFSDGDILLLGTIWLRFNVEENIAHNPRNNDSQQEITDIDGEQPT